MDGSWDSSRFACYLGGAWHGVDMVIKDPAFTYIPIGLCNASYTRCILSFLYQNLSAERHVLSRSGLGN